MDNNYNNVEVKDTNIQMETKKKNQKGNGVLIIILVLIIFCLGGFIVYDKVICKEKTANNIKPTETNESSDTSNEVVKNNDYKLFAENVKKNFANYDKDGLDLSSCIISDRLSHYQYDVCLSVNNEISINYYGSDSKYSVKNLTNNVINYALVSNQGGMQTLIVIYEDGTVGKVNTEYELEKGIMVKKSTKLKNIIYVYNNVTGALGSGIGTVYVDINGNVFSDKDF